MFCAPTVNTRVYTDPILFALQHFFEPFTAPKTWCLARVRSLTVIWLHLSLYILLCCSASSISQSRFHAFFSRCHSCFIWLMMRCHLCPWAGENPRWQKVFVCACGMPACVSREGLSLSVAVHVYECAIVFGMCVACAGLQEWQTLGLCCHSRWEDDLLVKGLRDRKADTANR